MHSNALTSFTTLICYLSLKLIFIQKELFKTAIFPEFSNDYKNPLFTTSLNWHSPMKCSQHTYMY